MQQMPKHYRLDVVPLLDYDLDTPYRAGWRVIRMTTHQDGKSVIVLMEKVSSPAKK